MRPKDVSPSGSGTATPLLVSPSEQLEPTLVALRFGSVCV